jgi:hypothetical protein
MVYVISSFRVAPGMMKEARDFLQRQGDYFKKAFGAQLVRMQAVTPSEGESDKILSIATFDSLAAWGEYQQKVEDDPKRNVLVNEAFSEKQLFILGGFARTVYKTI